MPVYQQEMGISKRHYHDIYLDNINIKVYLLRSKQHFPYLCIVKNPINIEYLWKINAKLALV